MSLTIIWIKADIVLDPWHAWLIGTSRVAVRSLLPYVFVTSPVIFCQYFPHQDRNELVLEMWPMAGRVSPGPVAIIP